MTSEPQDYDLDRDYPRPTRKKGLSEEWRLQCACAKIARQLHRADPLFRYEFINTEGQRDMKRAAIAKMMGLERGTLEARVYYPHKSILKMGIGDVKSEKGRATPEQKAWLEYFNQYAVLGMLIYSTDDYWKLCDWVRKA